MSWPARARGQDLHCRLSGTIEGVGTVLAVLGVLSVLFVAAVVATRDGELLVDAPRDRADLDLPVDGPLHADDLDRVRFGMALRGYRMAEVDALLQRLVVELRDRDARLSAHEGGTPPSPAPFPEPVHVDEPARPMSPPGGRSTGAAKGDR